MATTEERIAQIAGRFAQGAQAFAQGREANRARALQEEAARRQRAIQAIQGAAQLQEATGRQISPEAYGQAIGTGDLGGISQMLQEAPTTDAFQLRQQEQQRRQRMLDLQAQEAERRASEAALPFAQTREGQKMALQNRLQMQRDAQKMNFDEQAKIAAQRSGLNLKENQFKAAGFAKRARMAEGELGELSPDVGTGFFEGIVGSGLYPEALKGTERKLFEQAQRNFISAVLRKESGAAISDQEFANEERKYFPQPGDTQAVLAQKKRAREQAIINLEAEGGPAVQFIAEAPEQPVRQAPMPSGLKSVGTAYAAPPQEQPGIMAQQHPEAKAAMEWALANPQHYKAKEILLRMGAQ